MTATVNVPTTAPTGGVMGGASWPGGGRRLTASGHFRETHPLAQVAAARCTELHGRAPKNVTACGACWEHVVRTDAVFAAESDLPQVPPPADPDLIDEIAVERACAGDPVALTGPETWAVVERLRAAGRTFREIGALVGRTPDALQRTTGSRQATGPATAPTGDAATVGEVAA